MGLFVANVLKTSQVCMGRPKIQIIWKYNAFLENALFQMYPLFQVTVYFGSESDKNEISLCVSSFFKLISTTESHKKLEIV